MKDTIDMKKYNNPSNNYIIISIIIIASILGSIYGVYINLNNLEYTTVIYVWINNHQNEINIAIVFNIWFKYFKKIFMVWISSFYKATYIIGYIVLFGVVFSAGFTFNTLLMIWGKKGIIIVIICCFVQAIITIVLIIEILNKRQYLHEKKKYLKQNIEILIKDIWLCMIMSIIDISIINIIIL